MNDPAGRRIQILVGVVAVLGVIAVVCGYLPGLVATGKATTVELAGGDQLAMFLAAIALPGIAVFRTPRWTPIVAWIVWTAACATILFGHYMAWAHLNEVDLSLSTPLWPLVVVACCLMVMAILIAVAIPCVRESSRVRGPEFPVAHLR